MGRPSRTLTANRFPPSGDAALPQSSSGVSLSVSPATSKPSLAASIASWRDGSDGFFRFLADVQPRVPSGTGGFVPFNPGPVERAEIAKALDGTDVSVAIFCWPRRHGKTLTSAMILIWRFVTRTAENIAVVANSERQVVDTAFRTIRQAFEHTPLLKQLVAAGMVMHFAHVADELPKHVRRLIEPFLRSSSANVAEVRF